MIDENGLKIILKCKETIQPNDEVLNELIANDFSICSWERLTISQLNFLWRRIHRW